MEAYDQLAAAVKPLNLTPLFREEEGQHIILLLEGVVKPEPSNPWVNLGLFLLTLFSMVIAGVNFAYDGPIPQGFVETVIILFSNLPIGFTYAVSLLGILLTHEFGHYIAARVHKIAVTLPYFIPFPLSLFGTMGAFIQLKEPPKNKRVLHDIGSAGPLAGLVVAIPVLIVGIILSPVIQIDPLSIPDQREIIIEGNSIFYLLIKYLVHGQLLPAPVSYGGQSPVWYWIKYLFSGYPIPINGWDIDLHPLAWAGWVGLFVTGLNLIPVGQLDGGHILYVLLGKRARKAVPVALVIILLLGLVWQGWWIWAILIYFLGRNHAEPLDQITKLDRPRKILAVFALVVFILVFMPVPLRSIQFP
jgi:membrane-associated protease RseP (regulator of RpoE activity)